MRWKSMTTLHMVSHLIFCAVQAQGTRLRLQVAGDSAVGFKVNIYEGDQLRVTRTGEFSMELYNLDLSIRADLPDWKGKSWTGNDSLIELVNEIYIPSFDASLQVTVRYELFGRVIKKTIRLFQPSMPDLYY